MTNPAEVPPVRDRFCGLIGGAPCMQDLYDRVTLAATVHDTALIVGESGTGKELVARATHHQSGAAPETFVPVNCAALPRALIESELFGSVRGAFSGATEAREGLVRAANGGTLFLDEITELEAEAQAKLLRLIQERCVRPVGATREIPVKVRILASTNQDLRGAMDRGRLRRDLYFRLQRWVIFVPPLRDRLSDIALLAAHFAQRWQAAVGGAEPPRLAPAAIDRLATYSWPGNVRELENVLVQAFSTARGPRIGPEDLPPLEEVPAARTAPAIAPVAASVCDVVSLRDAERFTISAALHRTAGNKTLASRLLGISRKQLYVKIKLYGLNGTHY